MLLALCGTPGTGKTSLFRAFRESVPGEGQNYLAVELNSFVREQGLILGEDPERGSLEVEVSRLASVFREQVLEREGRPPLVLVEGHLSHLLEPDLLLLLRCRPSLLEDRLRARGYPEAKVRENLEAEAMGIIRDEYLEILETPGDYHQQFLSVFRDPGGQEGLKGCPECYLENPAHPSAGPALASTLATLPLLELDSSSTDVQELLGLLKGFLALRMGAVGEIETLNTEKEAPVDSSASQVEEGETLLSQLGLSSFLNSSCPLPEGYAAGTIDWSSEILTWY